jgi:hypothetical protein
MDAALTDHHGDDSHGQQEACDDSIWRASYLKKSRENAV